MTSPEKAAARWTTASTPAEQGLEVPRCAGRPSALSMPALAGVGSEPATGRSNARTECPCCDQRCRRRAAEEATRSRQQDLHVPASSAVRSRTSRLTASIWSGPIGAGAPVRSAV